jgi:hypothetical protein
MPKFPNVSILEFRIYLELGALNSGFIHIIFLMFRKVR